MQEENYKMNVLGGKQIEDKAYFYKVCVSHFSINFYLSKHKGYFPCKGEERNSQNDLTFLHLVTKEEMSFSVLAVS